MRRRNNGIGQGDGRPVCWLPDADGEHFSPGVEYAVCVVVALCLVALVGALYLWVWPSLIAASIVN